MNPTNAKTLTLRIDNSAGVVDDVISLPTDDSRIGDLQIQCVSGTVEIMGYDEPGISLFNRPVTPVLIEEGQWFTFLAPGVQAERTITVKIGAIAQFVSNQ